MPGVIIVLKYPKPLFLFNWEGKNVSEYSDLGNCWQEIMRNDKNNATLKTVQTEFSPGLGVNDGKINSTWNLGSIFCYHILKWEIYMKENMNQRQSPFMH